MARFGVIADDLTGACDVAGAFASAGLSATVDLGGYAPEVPAADVLVYDANVRDARDDVAACRLRDGIARLERWGVGLGLLKVDSTLRGPVRALVSEALALGVARRAVVATAFPAQGRTVKGGRLVVRGRDVGLDVEAVVGTGASRASLGAVAATGGARPRISVLEDQDDEVLAGLAGWWANAGDKPLLVGSAGLARHLAAALASEDEPGTSLARGVTRRTDRPGTAWYLVACGSPTPESGRQVAALRRAVGRERTWQGEEVVLLASPPARDRDDGSAAASLAQEVKQAVENRGSAPSAAVLVGGNTARAVLVALGVRAVQVVGEASSGVPVGYAVGGALDGMPLATKAGGFGGDDVLVETLAAVHPLARTGSA